MKAEIQQYFVFFKYFSILYYWKGTGRTGKFRYGVIKS